MPGTYRLTTKSGEELGVVASAFQKAIRRGLEDEALHWGVELDISNYGEYAWKRMRIITSEDVGLAEPHLPATIHALYQNWLDQRKKKDEKHAPERLFFIHAILLLCRARKSRIVDHALITYYNNHTPRPVPDFAFDKHTLAGRRMGRGVAHWFDEGIRLNPAPELPDPYEDTARETMLRQEGQRQGGENRSTLFDDEI